MFPVAETHVYGSSGGDGVGNESGCDAWGVANDDVFDYGEGEGEGGDLGDETL